MAASPSVAKRRLKNTTMQIQHVTSAHQSTYTSAVWRVAPLTKVEDWVKYRCSVRELGMKLELTKYVTRLRIRIYINPLNVNNSSKEYSVSAIIDESELSAPIRARETEQGVFEVEIRRISGLFLRAWRDTRFLSLKFTFDNRHRRTSKVRACSSVSRDLSFEQKLLGDHLVRILSTESFMNFLVVARDWKQLSHKAFLAARSGYFKKNMHKHSHGSIELNATADTARSVMNYLCWGTLVLQNDTPMDSTLQLAKSLEIPALLKICEIFFTERITEDNVDGIMELGVQSCLQSLIDAADASLPRRTPLYSAKIFDFDCLKSYTRTDDD